MLSAEMQNAIRRYQSTNGLRQTGDLDSDTLAVKGYPNVKRLNLRSANLGEGVGATYASRPLVTHSGPYTMATIRNAIVPR